MLGRTHLQDREPLPAQDHNVQLWNNTQTVGFVGFAVCLVVWTLFLILTSTHVGILQVILRKNKKQTTNRGCYIIVEVFFLYYHFSFCISYLSV